MSVATTAALFGTLLVLALAPSVSVMTVSARSAAYGFPHGVYTSLGIVVGDVVFIVIALFGLSLLADMLGGQFALIKYLAGIYLIVLGIVLFLSKPPVERQEARMDSSLSSSFLAGLLITLGDQKAILFYLGLFPAFVNLTAVTVIDTVIIIVITVVAVGGAKLVYAYAADKAGLLFGRSKIYKVLNSVAGIVLVGVGMYLLLRA